MRAANTLHLSLRSAAHRNLRRLTNLSARTRPITGGGTATDGTATEDCVPTCTADRHGVLLLLNIDGEDSKLSCELHHALYSWVGAAVRCLPSP